MKKFNESFSFVSKCDSLERDRLKFLRSSKRRNGITKDGVSNGTIQPRGKIGFGHGPFVTSSRTRNRRATSTVRPSTVVPVHRSMEKNTWNSGPSTSIAINHDRRNDRYETCQGSTYSDSSTCC